MFFTLIIHIVTHRREQPNVYSRRCNLYSFKIWLGSVTSTILLTNEVSLSNALNVTNATINGNGNTITGGQMGTNARIINLTGLNEDVSLVLNGVHMVGETAQFNSKGKLL